MFEGTIGRIVLCQRNFRDFLGLFKLFTTLNRFRARAGFELVFSGLPNSSLT